MKTRLFVFAAVIGIVMLIASQVPFDVGAKQDAKQIFVCWHHESQGVGDPSKDSCMPDDSISGHDGHVGDGLAPEGACEKCGEDPTATAVPPTETPIPPTETPIPPTATPVPPTATPVPTDEPPSFNFEWDIDTGCVQPFIRVHNLGNRPVTVTGEIWAGTIQVSGVPPQYQTVPPGWWGGPEGDLPNNYVGPLTGWVKVEYNGEEIASKEISLQKNCAPQPSPSPTTPPDITPQPDAHTGASEDWGFNPLWLLGLLVIPIGLGIRRKITS